MTKPNLFIVGAPKCGTTALSEYLREHPNVFMCEPKEPFYFATDFPRYESIIAKTEEEYLALFEGVTESEYVVGEASVIYLYSKEAIQNIMNFSSNAKIIVMLRNPVELVYSMHSQLLYSSDEDEADFEKAWNLIEQRKKGNNIPEKCRDRKMIFYDEIAKQGEQLERLLNIFKKENVKVIFSEDFFNNTEKVYQDVLGFLGLENDNRKSFPRINQNKHHKFRWLGQFTQRPPHKLINFILKIKNTLGIKQLRILDVLRKINLIKVERKSLSNEFKRLIIKSYYNDILKLSELTGRNLESWRECK